MAKRFKDFTYLNKKFSSLSTEYLCVSFEDSDETELAFNRDMEQGDPTRYRLRANYFYDTWDDNLGFELDILKNPFVYKGDSRELTRVEIEEIGRWLTSSHLPNWIVFDNCDDEIINFGDSVTHYHGYFDTIEPYVLNNVIYGLRMHFQCTTPFAYTDDIVNEITVSSGQYGNLLIQNDSDELYSYCYPTIKIHPNGNCQLFICNQSDYNVLDTGKLSGDDLFDTMLDTLEEYGTLHGYTVDYAGDSGDSAFNIIPLCDDTAVQFYYIDKYDNRTKCTAYYLTNSNVYYIVEGGFMYMTVYKDLDVYMDCEKLIISDELGRMLTYDELGISDVDNMYWLKLIHGYNTLLLYGDCDFTFTHREARKVGG